ncbi:MAG: hypothetical protein H6Q68_1173 [Firmicutes bacterium]|nr:hypothetical protein [Bacillota bacterium]
MITEKTAIIQVIRSHRLARDIFAKHGMGCIGCMGATTETIENCAKMHDIDAEALLKELNELDIGK